MITTPWSTVTAVMVPNRGWGKKASINCKSLNQEALPQGKKSSREESKSVERRQALSNKTKNSTWQEGMRCHRDMQEAAQPVGKRYLCRSWGRIYRY